MERPRPDGEPQSQRDPDFELPRHRAITEENWPEYEAQGFSVWEDAVDDKDLASSLDAAQTFCSTLNVYTGDAYDAKEGRPLRHKPGTGIYIHPAGREYQKEQQEYWKRYWERKNQKDR